MARAAGCSPVSGRGCCRSDLRPPCTQHSGVVHHSCAIGGHRALKHHRVPRAIAGRDAGQHGDGKPDLARSFDGLFQPATGHRPAHRDICRQRRDGGAKRRLGAGLELAWPAVWGPCQHDQPQGNRRAVRRKKGTERTCGGAGGGQCGKSSGLSRPSAAIHSSR